MNPAASPSLKVLLVGDTSSTHIQNWAKQLEEANLEIGIIDPGHFSGIRGFLNQLIKTKTQIKSFKPDIVHYHYASRYGLTALLVDFSPSVISVWGSDITVFPHKSFLHKALIKKIIGYPKKLLATSDFLARETKAIFNREVLVTPFGVDTDQFSPQSTSHLNKDIRIGCLKNYRDIYGIRELIAAFSILKANFPNNKLTLVLAGADRKIFQPEKVMAEFNLNEQDVELHNQVPISEMPELHRSLTIAVYPSRIEGYGVSALESSACGIPVVASAVGGHLEVVKHEQTGLHIQPSSIEEIIAGVSQLINHPELRAQYGISGRDWVVHNYSHNIATAKMLTVYNQVAQR